MTEEQFDAACRGYHDRMQEFMGTARDDSTPALERELEFVSELLEFLITSRESTPAHQQMQIAADIEHLTGTIELMGQALFARRSAEAEALLLASGCGQITIQ